MSASISRCDFVAVDVEFTGLNDQFRFKFDTPALFYSRITNVEFRPVIIQIGLSMFRWDAESCRYGVDSYNVSVFPDVTDRNRSLMVGTGFEAFLCQGNSLRFLLNSGFDFNEWMCSGIPFMRADLEDDLINRQKMLHRVRYQDENRLTQAQCENYEVALAKEIEICQQFFQSPQNEKVLVTFEVMKFHNWLRYRYKDKVFDSWVKGDKGGYRVTLVKCRDKEKYQDCANRYLECMISQQCDIGFTKILLLLSQSQKPILGHNMFLDLWFIISWFFCKLPKNLVDYKHLVQTTFGKIFDTKVIAMEDCSKGTFRSSALHRLVKDIERVVPVVQFDESNAYSDMSRCSGRAHQAGFDAQTTGKLFVYLSLYISKRYSNFNRSPNCVKVCWEVMNPYQRKIYLSGILDMAVVDFAQDEDHLPNRDAILFLNLPNPTTTDGELRHIFGKQGFMGIHIYWQSSNTVFVVMPDALQAQRVVDSFGTHPNDWHNVNVMSFAQFEHSQQSQFMLNND